MVSHKGKSALNILGSPDDFKFRSCLTLYGEAASDKSDKSLFAEALNQFYNGEPDPRTLELPPLFFLSLQGVASSRSYRSSFIFFLEAADAGIPNQILNYAKRATVDYLIHPAFMRALIIIASHFLRDTLKPSRIPACLMVFPSSDSLQPLRSSVAQSARSSIDFIPCSPKATSIRVVTPGISLSASSTPSTFRF